jgi:CheY-like chemotaxis protein
MSHKLLLADDSVTIQRVVELTFADQDVQVLAVGDGEQAIARIPVDQPDIVLADIGMPKRSGYDVAAFVKNNPELRHIPVLLLAGAFEPVDEARAEQVGCNGVLVKPFEPRHVIARVRELLGGATGAPLQATPDVGRPVDRLAAPRPVDIPAPAEPAPLEDAPSIPSAMDEPSYPASEPPSDAVADGLQMPAQEMPEFRPGESLDDYFARLGAALESPSAPAATPESPVEEGVSLDEALEVPTLEDILGTNSAPTPAPDIDLPLNSVTIESFAPAPAVEPPPIEPPDTSATLAPAAATPEQVDSGRNIVADAFTALLAVEQGEPGATPIRLAAAAPAQPAITDELVDELTRRVLDRLAPQAVRHVVTDVVSDVAERLVREEIQRIRSRQ